MKIKKILAGLMSLSILTFSLPLLTAYGLATQANAFTDVTISNPHYDAILYLKTKGVVSGYPDGSFKPDQIVNRAEALKIILIAAKIDAPETTSNGGLSDVDGNAWYARFIVKAKMLLIAQGYADGKFRPEQTVNLVEALKMALKAKNIDITNIAVDENPFADAFKAEWYAKFVMYAKIKNIIEANSNNMIFPAQGFTRAKLAEMIYRLLIIEENHLNMFQLQDGEIPGMPGPTPTPNPNPTPNPVPNPAIVNVNIQDFAFSPPTLNVKVGDTVIWTNKDVMSHTITSDSGTTLNSSLLSQNQTYSMTFTQAGTFDYHCSLHAFMKGKVVVTAP